MTTLDDTNQRRYAVFISYRHADNKDLGRRWANWLHENLENYEVPADLIGTANLRGEKVVGSLYPVFRDEEELPADADLSTSIRRALDQAGLLVVICSPRAVQSRFVADEIRYFKESGKSERILALMIDGEPNASDDPLKISQYGTAAECFPMPVRFGVSSAHGRIDWAARTEPIAADVRPAGQCRQGWTTAAAYEEELRRGSSLDSKEIVRRVRDYAAQLELARLKIVAGALGLPLGELTRRDQANQLQKARQRARALRRWLAAVLALVLLSTGALLLAKRTLAKQEELLWKASRSDHEAALRSFAEARRGDGLAYLGRSLEYRPSNPSAFAASVAHAFGLSSSLWKTRRVVDLKEGIKELTLSADSKLLAVISGRIDSPNRDLWIFDVQTGDEFRKEHFPQGIDAVQLSPDGETLAVAVKGGEIRMVVTKNGQLKRSFKVGDIVNSLAFTPDGALLAIGSTVLKGQKAEGSLRLLETASGQERKAIAFPVTVESCSFDASGLRLAVGIGGYFGKGEVRVYETENTHQIAEYSYAQGISSVALSSDGGLLAVGGADGRAQVIETLGGTEICKFQFSKYVSRVAFSFDDRFLVAGGADHTAKVLEVQSGRPVAEVNGGQDVTGLSFSSDGRWLIVGNADASLRFLETVPGEEILRLDIGNSIECLAVHPDGRELAVGGRATVEIYDASTGVLLRTLDCGTSVNSVAFSPSGDHLAAGCGASPAEGVVIVWDLKAGKEILRMKRDKMVNAVRYHPRDGSLLAGCEDGTLISVDIMGAKETHIAAFGSRVDSIAIDPQGLRYAVGFTEATGCKAELLSSGADHAFRSMEYGHYSTVSSLSFSGDGTMWAAGSWDGRVRVMDIASGAGRADVELWDSVTSIQFCQKGRWILAGCKDKTLRTYEAATGKEVGRTSLEDYPWALAVNEPTQTIAVATKDGIVRIYDSRWLPSGTMSAEDEWQEAIRFQAGSGFDDAGAKNVVSASSLVVMASKKQDWVAREPARAWQQAILRWSRQSGEERKTSPWTEEPIRIAVGRWLQNAKYTATLIDCANKAPWHPLVPVAVACFRPEDENKQSSGPRGSTSREAILARLTMQRLREASESLYDRRTLATYATWAADIMHQQLHLDATAREAISFALERTPADDQTELRRLEAELKP